MIKDNQKRLNNFHVVLDAIVILLSYALAWYIPVSYTHLDVYKRQVLIGMCFLGSVQIFFIGLVGEYILSINSRVMKRPLVIEEERLNFEENHHPESNPQDRGKTPCNADVEAGREQQVQG